MTLWSDAHLENIEESPCVEAGLLVGSSEQRSLLAAVGEQGGVQVELEALGDLVLELNLGAEDVAGCPRLGEDEAMLLVRVLGLEVTVDGGRLGVAKTADLEGDVGWCRGFDLERSSVEVEISDEQVVGGFTEILRVDVQQRVAT